jgi:hypothetical protein
MMAPMSDVPPRTRVEAEGTKYAVLYDTPTHWPREVRILSIDAMDALGHDPRTNQLYWDGQPLVTEKRFSNFERMLAVIGLVVGGVGVGATVVQAAIAWLAYAKL